MVKYSLQPSRLVLRISLNIVEKLIVFEFGWIFIPSLASLSALSFPSTWAFVCPGTHAIVSVAPLSLSRFAAFIALI